MLSTHSRGVQGPPAQATISDVRWSWQRPLRSTQPTQPLFGGLDLLSGPVDPGRLMALLAEIPQDVRHEVQRFVEHQSGVGDFGGQAEILAAKPIAQLPDLGSPPWMPDGERPQVGQEIGRVIGTFRLAGAVEVNNPDAAVVADEHIAVRQIAMSE